MKSLTQFLVAATILILLSGCGATMNVKPMPAHNTMINSDVPVVTMWNILEW